MQGFSDLFTSWKVSVFGVILVRIFPNGGKYEPEQLRIRTLFTQLFFFCVRTESKIPDDTDQKKARSGIIYTVLNTKTIILNGSCGLETLQ